jgi:hypothetical protein
VVNENSTWPTSAITQGAQRGGFSPSHSSTVSRADRSGPAPPAASTVTPGGTAATAAAAVIRAFRWQNDG